MSLGEILAIEGVVKELGRDKRIELILTTTTSTGFAEAKKRYSDLCREIKYFPLDFWPIARRVWHRVKPDLAVCVETELWPEFLRQAEQRGVPVVVVNGRLSDRSYQRGRKYAGWFRRELRSIRRVLAGSVQDAERFRGIGVPEDRIRTVGNLKTDISIEPILSSDERRSLKREIGMGDRFVLLGSSTWPGEEEMLVEAFGRLRERLPESALLIVPRHGERRGEIRTLMQRIARGYEWRLRSSGESVERLDILVADTHGELRQFTQLADLAFIGKSLPPRREGQTPIECGLLGVPSVMGPGMRNFPGVAEQLARRGASCQVADREEAIEQIVRLAGDPGERARMSQACREWAESNRGAIRRTLEEIRSFIDD